MSKKTWLKMIFIYSLVVYFLILKREIHIKMQLSYKTSTSQTHPSDSNSIWSSYRAQDRKTLWSLVQDADLAAARDQHCLQPLQNNTCIKVAKEKWLTCFCFSQKYMLFTSTVLSLDILFLCFYWDFIESIFICF